MAAGAPLHSCSQTTCTFALVTQPYWLCLLLSFWPCGKHDSKLGQGSTFWPAPCADVGRHCGQGYDVDVYESRPFIGGKVASWQKDGNHVEMGLHVVRHSAAPPSACVCVLLTEAEHGPGGSVCLRAELMSIGWHKHADLCLLQCLLMRVSFGGSLQLW